MPRFPEIFYVALVDRNDPSQFLIDPIIVAGDFQWSDGGAFTNLTLTPMVEPAGSPQVRVQMSPGEGEAVSILARDQAGEEWQEAYITPSDCLPADEEEEAELLGPSSFPETFYLMLIDINNPSQFLVDPLIQAGDFQISDGTVFTNLANLPVVTPAGSAQVKVDLEPEERNQKAIFGKDLIGNLWQEIYITPSDCLGQLMENINLSASDAVELKAKTAAIGGKGMVARSVTKGKTARVGGVGVSRVTGGSGGGRVIGG